MKITNIQYGRNSGLPIPPQALLALPKEIPVPPGTGTDRCSIENLIWQVTGFRTYGYDIVEDDKE